MSANTTGTATGDFAERLARVHANKGREIIMVGQDERVERERKQSVQVSRGREVAQNVKYPASLAGAFLIGSFAVALGQFARFHFMSGQSEMAEPDLEMLLSGFVGVCISFALAQFFRLTSKEHKAMQSAGVFLMVCTFHNLAHWAPGPMSFAFSQENVANVVSNTGANTFRFRGAEFLLFETANADAPADGCAAAAAPPVKRIALSGDRSKSAGPTRISAVPTCD